MKLTPAERKVLEAIRSPVYVKSKIIMGELEKLSQDGLCEIAQPLEWQRSSEGGKIYGLAVITSAGREALIASRNTQEAAHACA